ncbi:MAG: HAD family hydrolase [Lentisphaeraceae bacterium]|nr:HAD family hydrolase [Lentisphaeraceae bacterium]
MIEFIEKPQVSQIKCVILDYDGTLTTFRRGWEKVLYKYSYDTVCGQVKPDGQLKIRIEGDIQNFVSHAGGSSPQQVMNNLLEIINKFDLRPKNEIKILSEYVMEYVLVFKKAISERLEKSYIDSNRYLIRRTREMLNYLQAKDILCYVVTGSSKSDVENELRILGLDHHFLQVYGASVTTVGNHKEEAIQEICTRHQLKNCETLIVGDGSVEIRAAQTLGLMSIGIASDEHQGGLCSHKRQTLIEAGAHVIIADYEHFETLWSELHS